MERGAVGSIIQTGTITHSENEMPLSYIPNGEVKYMALVAVLSAIAAIIIRLIFWE